MERWFYRYAAAVPALAGLLLLATAVVAAAPGPDGAAPAAPQPAAAEPGTGAAPSGPAQQEEDGGWGNLALYGLLFLAVVLFIMAFSVVAVWLRRRRRGRAP